jgi:hypothetical protein
MSSAVMLFNTYSGESFQANELGILIIEKVKKNYTRANIEEFILSEFDIDNETMEEHLEELLSYMIHNKLIDKIPGK